MKNIEDLYTRPAVGCAKPYIPLYFTQLHTCMNCRIWLPVPTVTGSDSYRYLRSKQLVCVELYTERLSVMCIDIT